MANEAEFVVNPTRYDPYKNYSFKVMWDGRTVAGVSKVSGLKRTADVVEHRSGGDPSSVHRTPGRTEYEAITLERGVTHDTEFGQWANKVWNYSTTSNATQPGTGNKEVSLADFRKDVVLEVYDEAGQKVLEYNIHGCWVSAFAGLPGLDGDANTVAIQTLKLENEGWERDTSVEEHAEPGQSGPGK